MRNKQAIVITVFLVLALGRMSIQGQDPAAPYVPLRLPAGETFPGPEASLLRMRDHPDAKGVAKMRAHAWDLFAGLTKDQPIWETWYTKCDVNLEVCGHEFVQGKPNLHQVIRSFEVPAQFLEGLSIALGSAGAPSAGGVLNSEPFDDQLTKFAILFRAHPQFASVLFNRESANRIRRDCLYPRNLPAPWNARKSCPPLPSAPGKIEDFERGAVVLKTVWARVIVGTDGIGELDTWQPELWHRIQQVNDSNLGRFRKSTVKIDTASRLPCQDRDYGDDETVPLSCFYAFMLTPEDVAAIVASPPDLAVIHTAGVVAGNYLVLVGVHVTTKEIPEWVWATFWWDNHGVSDPFAAGRPTSVQPRWRHFLMDTTFSGMSPVENDSGPKICFNPNLETGILNGAISNCLQCHSKAAFGPKPKENPYILGILGRDGTTLAGSGQIPDPDYLNDRVQTDFLWSIADAQNPKLGNVRDLFEKKLVELQLLQNR